MSEGLADIKRLAGLQETEVVSEAAVRTIDDAIAALANLRQSAKEMQLKHINTNGLANDIIEDLYPVILFLEQHKATMHHG
jgi:3,4-dihydroxy-2-butanone 4-phosphate synthase